jgi:hypothetical protein
MNITFNNERGNEIDKTEKKNFFGRYKAIGIFCLSLTVYQKVT